MPIMQIIDSRFLKLVYRGSSLKDGMLCEYLHHTVPYCVCWWRRSFFFNVESPFPARLVSFSFHLVSKYRGYSWVLRSILEEDWKITFVLYFHPLFHFPYSTSDPFMQVHKKIPYSTHAQLVER